MVRPAGIARPLLLAGASAAALLASSAFLVALAAVAAVAFRTSSSFSRRAFCAAISACSSSIEAAWAGAVRARLPKQARMARLIGCFCIVSPPWNFIARGCPGVVAPGGRRLKRNKLSICFRCLEAEQSLAMSLAGGEKPAPEPTEETRHENSAGRRPSRTRRMGGQVAAPGRLCRRYRRLRQSRRALPADRRLRRRAARPVAARQGRHGRAAQPAGARLAYAGADLHGTRFGR